MDRLEAIRKLAPIMDAEPEAKSLSREFVDSAMYAAMQQPATAVAQVADHLTGSDLQSKVKFMNAPAEAKFGSERWHAQTLGGAVGSLVPLIITGSIAKSTLGTTAAETTLFSRQAAIGLSVREAALTGFLADSVFKPTGEIKPGATFLQTRLAQGLGGAMTFAAMSGASLKLGSIASGEVAQKIGVSGLLKNPVSNGILAGVPGGVVASEYDSLLRHDRVASSAELLQSVYSTSLVGGAFGLKHQLASKFKGPEIAVDAIGKQNPESAFLRPDGLKTPQFEKLVDKIEAKFNGEPFSNADITKVVERFAPEDRPLAIAFLQKSALNATDVGVMKQLREVFEQHQSPLPKASNGWEPQAHVLGTSTSGNLLSYLFRKSNPEGVKALEIKFLSETKPGDKPSPISAPDSVPKEQVIALENARWREQKTQWGNSEILLLDDLSTSKLTEGERVALSQAKKVTVVDLSSFEKGVNFIDTALGPDAVYKKLHGLVTEAKSTQSRSGSPMNITESVNAVLSKPAEDAVKAIGPNAVVVRPKTTQTDVSTATIDSVHQLLSQPKVGRESIGNFLLSRYHSSQQSHATELLLNDTEYIGVRETINRAKTLGTQMKSTLAAQGKSIDDVVVLVDREHSGGSSHAMAYLFKQLNGLSDGNFVSSKQLEQTKGNFDKTKTTMALIDDNMLTGHQMMNGIFQLYNGLPLEKAPDTMIGVLASSDSRVWSGYMGQVDAVRAGKVGFLAANPLASERGSTNLTDGTTGLSRGGFSRGTLSRGARLLSEAQPQESHGQWGRPFHSTIWWYMWPDTTNGYSADFAKSALKLSGT